MRRSRRSGSRRVQAATSRFAVQPAIPERPTTLMRHRTPPRARHARDRRSCGCRQADRKRAFAHHASDRARVCAPHRIERPGVLATRAEQPRVALLAVAARRRIRSCGILVPVEVGAPPGERDGHFPRGPESYIWSSTPRRCRAIPGLTWWWSGAGDAKPRTVEWLHGAKTAARPRERGPVHSRGVENRLKSISYRYRGKLDHEALFRDTFGKREAAGQGSDTATSGSWKRDPPISEFRASFDDGLCWPKG